MVSIISKITLSIVGLVVINILVDIVLPKKSMGTMVKTICSFLIILSILTSFTNIDLSNISFDYSMTNNVDSNFITNRAEELSNLYEKEIIKNLENNGYNEVSIDIKLDNEQKIKNVYVDLSRLVLTENSLNINKYTNIIAIIKKIVNVKEEQIIFYE